MANRPTWFWTSLFSSIGVNAVMLTSSACWMYSQTKVYVPGYGRAIATAPVFINAPVLPDDQRLGDSAGKGDAIDASLGETPQEAMKADQAQALFTRDPEGEEHSAEPAPVADATDGSPAPTFGAAASESPTPKFASKAPAPRVPAQVDPVQHEDADETRPAKN